MLIVKPSFLLIIPKYWQLKGMADSIRHLMIGGFNPPCLDSLMSLIPRDWDKLWFNATM
jgi:hypothetical protein